jgi:hypothetical protein
MARFPSANNGGIRADHGTRKMTLSEKAPPVVEAALVGGEARNGSSIPPLLPQHVADLRASGLSDATIRRWGCYSVDTDQK